MWVLYPRSSVVSVVLVGFLQLFNQLVNRWYPELGLGSHNFLMLDLTFAVKNGTLRSRDHV